MDEQRPKIDDLDQLKQAIRAVGRGADRDTTRKHVIKRAKALGHSDLIPDSWAADGSLKEAKSAWADNEQRDTAMDVFTALDGAVADYCEDDFNSWSVWVQDWYGTEDDGYTVVYTAGGELYACGFSYDDENKVVLDEKPVKVRPVTSYVERQKVSQIAEWRKRKAQDLKGLERRDFAASELELREKDEDTWALTGYASVFETPYDVGFYTETVKRGAAKRTLSENPDVQLLINHEGLPLARTRSGTLRLEERERGLWVDADLDKHDPDAQSLQRKMARGDIDQMSFAFQVTDQEWDEDYTKRDIRSFSIHRGDVSVVNMAANPAAVAAIRSMEALQALKRSGSEGLIAALTEWRDRSLLATEKREELSGQSMEVFARLAELLTDDGEAEPLLRELMTLSGGKIIAPEASAERSADDDVLIAKARLDLAR